MTDVNRIEAHESVGETTEQASLLNKLIGSVRIKFINLLEYVENRKNIRKKIRDRHIEDEKIENEISCILDELVQKGELNKESELYEKMHEYLMKGYLYINDLRISLKEHIGKRVIPVCDKIIKKGDKFLPDTYLTESEKYLLAYCINNGYIEGETIGKVSDIFNRIGINLNYYDEKYLKGDLITNLMLKLGLDVEQIGSYKY